MVLEVKRNQQLHVAWITTAQDMHPSNPGLKNNKP